MGARKSRLYFISSLNSLSVFCYIYFNFALSGEVYKFILIELSTMGYILPELSEDTKDSGLNSYSIGDPEHLDIMVMLTPPLEILTPLSS